MHSTLGPFRREMAEFLPETTGEVPTIHPALSSFREMAESLPESPPMGEVPTIHSALSSSFRSEVAEFLEMLSCLPGVETGGNDSPPTEDPSTRVAA